MDSDRFYFLRDSTLVGWLRRGYLHKEERDFWVFLLFAIFVDNGICVWVGTGHRTGTSMVFGFYCLTEALVFFAFIRCSSGNLLLRRFIFLMLVLSFF